MSVTAQNLVHLHFPQTPPVPGLELPGNSQLFLQSSWSYSYPIKHQGSTSIHSFPTMCPALGRQVKETVSAPKEPSRGAHTPRIPREGSFPEFRAPRARATLLASPAAQGSCHLSDTVPTSSPTGAYEIQQPRGACSCPAFYIICWAESVSLRPQIQEAKSLW